MAPRTQEQLKRAEAFIKFVYVKLSKTNNIRDIIHSIDDATPSIKNPDTVWGEVAQLNEENDVTHRNRYQAAWRCDCDNVTLSLRWKVLKHFELHEDQELLNPRFWKQREAAVSEKARSTAQDHFRRASKEDSSESQGVIQSYRTRNDKSAKKGKQSSLPDKDSSVSRSESTDRSRPDIRDRTLMGECELTFAPGSSSTPILNAARLARPLIATYLIQEHDK